MPGDSQLPEFIEKALGAGISQESVVGVLVARGWPEKEVYGALAERYRTLTGMEIPRRAAAVASAKEAFFYLLIFSTLATWTIGFGNLAAALIDRLLPDPIDPLISGYPQVADPHSIPSSLAALMVAFPLYLLISRAVARETVAHPEQRDSPVRKWLTYIALVIAAGVFMGDLIDVLTHFLRGEATSRFLAKSLVILLLSGGVFSYYFGGLRETEGGSGKPGRDRLMAFVSSGVVALLIVLGFLQLGSPGKQRELRVDQQRVQQLVQLSMEVNGYWSKHGSQLPSSIDQASVTAYADPASHVPYEYHPGQGSRYELCATFSRN